MRRRLFSSAVLVFAMTSTSLAQSKAPIGRFAADARVVSAGLPGDPGWTPAVPLNTVVPSRGLGIEVGAHLYVLRIRAATIGVGASWMTARATTAPPEVPQTGSTAATSTFPDVSTRLTSIAPQLSLNFGHALGFSYVSAGLGRAKAFSEAALANSTVTFTPRDSGWVKTLNFGGGARWYINDHVGVGFDLRWHKLSLVAATNTRPGAPRASLIVAGAGVVLK
jgi:hypothetical protein